MNGYYFDENRFNGCSKKYEENCGEEERGRLVLVVRRRRRQYVDLFRPSEVPLPVYYRARARTGCRC